MTSNEKQLNIFEWNFAQAYMSTNYIYILCVRFQLDRSRHSRVVMNWIFRVWVTHSMLRNILKTFFYKDLKIIIIYTKTKVSLLWGSEKKCWNHVKWNLSYLAQRRGYDVRCLWQHCSPTKQKLLLKACSFEKLKFLASQQRRYMGVSRNLNDNHNRANSMQNQQKTHTHTAFRDAKIYLSK